MKFDEQILDLSQFIPLNHDRLLSLVGYLATLTINIFQNYFNTPFRIRLSAVRLVIVSQL